MATALTKGKKYSQYHPQRPCGPCIVCGKSCPYYTHYGTWDDEEKDFLRRHWGAEPKHSDCLCIAHHREAQRNHSSPGYIPKWSKTSSSKRTQVSCMYPSCSSTGKLITPSFAPASELQAELQAPSEQSSLLVCPNHYQVLYRQFNRKPCASCDIRPKAGTTFSRHCPNASLINEIFQRGGEIGTLGPADFICNVCYKTHLALVKSYDQRECLSDMIKIWETELANDHDKLTKAVLHSVLYVSNEFENEKAVLLPWVSRVFLRHYCDGALDAGSENKDKLLESSEGTVKFTSRWLLKQLTVHLHSHMSCKCIHKKFGTLLFKKGGDLMVSLSWALGTGNHEVGKRSDFESTPAMLTPARKPSKDQVLRDAGDIINDIIHSEMTKHSNTEGMDQFNIDKQINEIHWTKT